MFVRSDRDHFDRVMKVAATPAPPLKTGDNQNIIHRSWFRCINELHLNPGEKPAPHVETADRLSQSCERIGDFLNVARAGIGQLFKQAPDVGYVLLTDADGVVVDSLGTDCWGDSWVKPVYSLVQTGTRHTREPMASAPASMSARRSHAITMSISLRATLA